MAPLLIDTEKLNEFEVLKYSGHRKVDGGEVIVRIEPIHLGYMFRTFVNGSVHCIELFEFERPRRLLVNNWQSWGPAKVIDGSFAFSFPSELREKFGYSASIMPETYFDNTISDYFIGADRFLVGALSSKVGHPYFLVTPENVKVRLDLFGKRFEDWTEVEKFVILIGEIDWLLPHYADLVAKENGVVVRAENLVGWSSWYQYFLDFDYEKMKVDLERSKGRGYQVFQVDDAWEKDIGDWEPNERFPNLEKIATEIRARGYVPGIWLAPFSVAETSTIYREHPDWLVKDENGSPRVAYQNWNKNIYALDTTYPEVKEWLRKLFSDLKDAGFEYFKIDFLFAGAIQGKRYTDCTPIEAYRQGLEVIRQTVGDSFILGCGAPLWPSVGYVDGMRIGADTATFWDPNGPDIGYPNAYYALRNVFTRWFMNGVFWWNDPDCLLLRLEDSQLSDSHRELYAYASALLDNMLIQSDNLSYRIDEKLWRDLMSIRTYGKRIVKLEGIMDGRYVVTSAGVDGVHKLFVEDLAQTVYRVELDEGKVRFVKRVEKKPDGRTFNYYEEQER
ncbi:glycoside hydrolase family 36 protein [Fervidobacterium thailandense]|uniref:Glycoside hydrolase n=1 Tax=Fervidobacterium thailandense TaxID=1008305 RepID=A0A1E3G213_9BACT|nr:alpha-galactosidase [Fervidobacterium thailandense]ODN30305.1 glycoside hydrolase [Fervidobacterium thailandense]